MTMNDYPEVVKIAIDYMDRLKSQLSLVPFREREDFLREIQSHIYEAYQQAAGEDEVAKILTVLRNLGESAEVVADRLPGSMVRSGSKRNLPFYVLGGILIAMFGIPLGFGGVGVLAGLLLAVSGIVVAFYAVAGSVILVGALCMSLGLVQTFLPQLWEKMIAAGILQMSGPAADFLDQLPTGEQGLILRLIASVIVAAGLGMLWLGRYLLRGLRFLYSLIFDGMRRAAQSIRRKLRRENGEAQPLGAVSYGK